MGKSTTALDRLLNSRGIKAQWLAQKLGVHKSQVSGWRRGLHVPDASTQVRIAKLLDVAVADLWPVKETKK